MVQRRSARLTLGTWSVDRWGYDTALPPQRCQVRGSWLRGQPSLLDLWATSFGTPSLPHRPKGPTPSRTRDAIMPTAFERCRRPGCGEVPVSATGEHWPPGDG
jgi:hypothetical protein